MDTIRYFTPDMEKIPHGSGIDGDWRVTRTKSGKWKFSNFYHGMDEVGYYDGYADFSIIVDPFDSGDFRITFHGGGFRHKSWFYGLSEYFGDMFAEWIHSCILEI